MKLLSTIVVVGVVMLARTTGALGQPTASGTIGASQDKAREIVNKDPDSDGDDDSKPAGNGEATVIDPDGDASVLSPAPTPTTSIPSAPTGPTPPVVVAPTSPPPVGFKNGSYTAVGNYTVEGKKESIGVTLVLSDGVVVDSSVTVMAKNPTSKYYQNNFAANYKPYVTGKRIDQLNLGKVSEASLTPIGFNDATNIIESQAKA